MQLYNAHMYVMLCNVIKHNYVIIISLAVKGRWCGSVKCVTAHTPHTGVTLTVYDVNGSAFTASVTSNLDNTLKDWLWFIVCSVWMTGWVTALTLDEMKGNMARGNGGDFMWQTWMKITFSFTAACSSLSSHQRQGARGLLWRGGEGRGVY